jgi:hypothetical protein
VRVVGVGYHVQDGEQRDRHGPGEVQHLPGASEDRGSIAQVRVDVLGGTCFAARQQRAGMSEHDRVVVDVHHPGLRGDRLGDLVGVTRCGDASADVQELTDPSVGRKVADGTPEERPVAARGGDCLRIDLQDRFGCRPVGGVIVLAAKKEIIYSSLVRHAGVKRQRTRLAAGQPRCVIAGHSLMPFTSRCQPAR